MTFARELAFITLAAGSLAGVSTYYLSANAPGPQKPVPTRPSAGGIPAPKVAEAAKPRPAPASPPAPAPEPARTEPAPPPTGGQVAEALAKAVSVPPPTPQVLATVDVATGASPGIPPAPSPAAASPAPAPTAPAQADGPWTPTPRPELIAKAEAMFDDGDIAGARHWLREALDQGDADAAFRLAETYDPAMLAKWKVIGIASDPARARALYDRAARGGVVEAGARVARLAP